LLIGLIAAAAAFLLCGGGGLVMYFVDPFGLFGAGPSNDMLAWAPADSQSISFVNVKEARTISEFRDGPGTIGDGTKYGIRSEDVDSVMMASQGGAGIFLFVNLDPEVTVFKLISSADRARIISTVGGREATAGNKKYYKTNAGGGIYFASDRLVVATRTEMTMTSLLQKDEGKVIVSDELRSLAKKTDGTLTTVATGSAAESADFLGFLAASGDALVAPGGPNFGARTAKARSTSFSVKVSGNRGTMRLESTYDSPDSARRIEEGVRKSIDANRKSNEFETYDISRSGSTVTFVGRGPVKRGSSPLFPGAK
jgi:hypothetical protein